jgi:chemotaxis protein CheX
MLKMPVKFENPIVKKTHHPTYDISSIIGITGLLSGCIILSYPEKIAKIVASEMLEEHLDEINDDLIDAICEIANMIAGVVDTDLELEYMQYSLPTVSIAKNKILYPSNSFIISMQCIIDSGVFEVDIAFSGTDKESIYETENTHC